MTCPCLAAVPRLRISTPWRNGAFSRRRRATSSRCPSQAPRGGPRSVRLLTYSPGRQGQVEVTSTFAAVLPLADELDDLRRGVWCWASARTPSFRAESSRPVFRCGDRGSLSGCRTSRRRSLPRSPARARTPHGTVHNLCRRRSPLPVVGASPGGCGPAPVQVWTPRLGGTVAPLGRLVERPPRSRRRFRRLGAR